MKSFGSIHGQLLVEETLPFWLEHGLDKEHEGFLSILDQSGRLVDTDKAIWVQGRAAWLFGRRPGPSSLGGNGWMRPALAVDF